ncbi:MAG: DUF6104 family protein [Cumulibacter sp.]
MYFTDRGIEELQQRREDEDLSVDWVCDMMRTFVDLHPQFESAIDQFAVFLARDDEDDD